MTQAFDKLKIAKNSLHDELLSELESKLWNKLDIGLRIELFRKIRSNLYPELKEELNKWNK